MICKKNVGWAWLHINMFDEYELWCSHDVIHIFRAQLGGPALESSNQKTIWSGENREIFLQIIISSVVKFHTEIS